MKHNNSEAKQVCDVYTDNVKKKSLQKYKQKKINLDQIQY